MKIETQSPSNPIAPAPAPATQKPVPSPALTDAQKYEVAYMKTWDVLPKWKQVIVTEDINTGVDSRFVNEFIGDVARLAETL